MFYLNEPIGYDEIAKEAAIRINLADRDFHCTCPGCGAEVLASAYDICENLVLTEDNENAYCPACSRKLLAEREADDEEDDEEDDSLTDMMIDDLIDLTRDEDGAQRFVYLRDEGIIVDIDHCKAPELIDAVIAWANSEIEDLDASLALCQKRIEELKKTASEPVWRVTWNDHEGNEQERRFNTLRDAIHEEIALKEKFDYVRTLDADGNEV